MGDRFCPLSREDDAGLGVGYTEVSERRRCSEAEDSDSVDDCVREPSGRSCGISMSQSWEGRETGGGGQEGGVGVTRSSVKGVERGEETVRETGI